MNSWLNGTLAMPITTVITSVIRPRETPLKNPASTHTPSPRGPATASRGHQNSSARRWTSGLRCRRRSSGAPRYAAATNSGVAASAAHSPLQAACEARV